MNCRVSTALSAQSRDAIGRLKRKFAGNDWAENYIARHTFRCSDDVTRVMAIKPGAHVLNIGGAPYIFEAVARVNGLKVTSLDLNSKRHCAVICEFGFDVKDVDIEDHESRATLDLSEYDVIVLAEVLEHMRFDLIGLLEDLRAAMRDDAALYLTTPNFYYFRRFISFLRHRRSGPSLVSEWSKLKRLGHMGHVREYSARELIELFEHVGFKVEACCVRTRSSVVRKTPLALLPTLAFTLLENNIDLFGQEFVFILRK